MNDDQKLILRMLEEGKISAEEAEELLNALGDAPSSEGEEKQVDVWTRMEKLGDDFAERTEQAVERFYRSLEGKTETRLAEKLAKLPKMLSRIPFVSSEETHEFVQEYVGAFQEGLELLPINLSTSNGRIAVQGWNEPGYKLVVVQRIKGKERDAALQRLYDIDWGDEEVRNSIAVHIPNLNEVSVSLQLFVPHDLPYYVDLKTHNGPVLVEDLRVQTVELSTINGSVKLRQVRAKTIEGRTNNGSCKMDQVEAATIRYRSGNGSYRLAVKADHLDCVSANGSIRITPLAGSENSKYILRTTNGSISAAVPAWTDAGVAFDLHTSVGRISMQLDQVEFSQNWRQGGGAHLVGKSIGFDNQNSKLQIAAETGSGSITVYPVGSGGDYN